MDEQEIYQQKHEAQMDEWEAELEKLKARASRASADAQLELSQRIGQLEEQLEEGKKALSDLADTGDDPWESTKERVDQAWTSLKAGFEQAREELDQEPGDGAGTDR